MFEEPFFVLELKIVFGKPPVCELTERSRA